MWRKAAIGALLAGLLAPAGVGGLLGAVPAAEAQAGLATEMASANRFGGPGDRESDRPHISANGRFVVFDSRGRDFVAGDGNGVQDVFIRNLDTNVTERVSVGTGNIQANEYSTLASVSADGSRIAFQSLADNLVPGDTNGDADIFVRDRTTGVTTRVSVSTGGGQANNYSTRPTISGDGTKIAFNSTASNLVPGDTNGVNDIFIHDMTTGTTTRINAAGGGQPNGVSVRPKFSNNGNVVVFESYAAMLPEDTNGVRDIYWYNLTTGQLRRASLDRNGQDSNGASRPELSADGRYVTFQSQATDLVRVPADTNANTDVFIRDMLDADGRDANEMISVSSTGEQGRSESTRGGVSADGRWVTFNSYSTNLVPGDNNNRSDVFLRDRVLGTTILVSQRMGGGGGSDGLSYRAEISDDGRYIVYRSAGTNLAPGDTNGTWDIFVTDRTMLGTIDDGAAPDGTIVAPTTDQRFTDGTVEAQGTATDDVAVSRIELVYRNAATGEFLTADGVFSPTFTTVTPRTTTGIGTRSATWSDDRALPDGTYVLTAYAKDIVDKTDPSPPQVRFVVGSDAAPPAGSITAPTRNQIVLGAVNVTGQATDDIAVAQVKVSIRNTVTKKWLQANGSFGNRQRLLDGTLANPGATSTTWSFGTTLPVGNFAAIAYAYDAAGNRTRIGAVAFRSRPTLSDEAPVITVRSPGADGIVSTMPAALRGRATDDSGLVSVVVAIGDDQGRWLQANGTWAATPAFLDAALADAGAVATAWGYRAELADGRYLAVVRAVDLSGQTTQARVPFTVDVTIQGR